MSKQIHIFGGGTVQHVRSHTALSAPAYGRTARKLQAMLSEKGLGDHVQVHFTTMADWQSPLETNEDVAARLEEVLADPNTVAIVFNVALCDVAGQIGDVPSGKYAPRLQSRETLGNMQLTATPKLLPRVKQARPDVFLVGFKTTADDTQLLQHQKSLRQIEETGADLVFANDTVTKHNMLVYPYGFYAGERDGMLTKLVDELERQL